ncbi:MAG: SulP family inorganic anion transporter [Chloroflexota bacterium]
MEKVELSKRATPIKGGAQIGTALANSVTIGLLESLWWVSIMTLVFSGPLFRFIGNATILIVGGGIVSAAIVAYNASWKGTISIYQDVPLAILALVASQMVNRLEPNVSLDGIFLTLLITVMFSTIGTGIFMLLLGRFRLGNIIRFFPYPVLAGFLGGTGWLLLIGGIGAALPTGDLSQILSLSALPYWVPAMLLAIMTYFVGERFSSPLTVPGVLIGGIFLFYTISFGLGYNHADLTRAGWFIGSVSVDAQFSFEPFLQFSAIEWHEVLAESGSIAVLIVASTIGMMLNNSGFELTVDEEFDLNHDLRVHGLSNIVAGFFGGWPSYVTPSWSALNAGDSKENPLTGLLFPIVAGVLLIFATQIFDYIPRLLSGALIAYMGLVFLVEWVVRPARRLPRLEYGMLILILCTITFFGLLQGVAAGLVMALLLFVVNYSRVNVWKSLMSGAHQQSRVTRVSDQRNYLRSIGEDTQILRLEGYLFFGSANSLLDKVRKLIDEIGFKRLVLDFEHVSGIDSTTLLSFSKIIKLLRQNEVDLILTSLSAETRQLLFDEGQIDETKEIKVFNGVDQALQMIEDKALIQAGYDPKAPLPSIEEQMQLTLPNATNIPQLLDLMEQQALEDGAVLMDAGAAADDMYFVKSGLVTAQLIRKSGKVIRLETMGTGRAVGEIGFYLNQDRTASVVSDGPSVVYRLTKERLQWIEATHPDVASTLHRLIINLLSDRVTHLVGVVDILQR